MNTAEQIMGYIAEESKIIETLAAKRQKIVQVVGNLKLPEKLRQVFLIGCGTSLNGSFAVQPLLEKTIGVPVTALPALEFLNYTPDELIGPDTLVIAFSQSGNTDVVCESCARALSKGSTTIAITDEFDSRLGKICNITLPICIGEETVGPKTKGFSASVMVSYLLTWSLSQRYTSDQSMPGYLERHFDMIADQVRVTFERSISLLDPIIQQLAGTQDLFVLGAGPAWSAAREGALKVLEIARIHAESIEAEEMCHGRFRIIHSNAPVILLAPTGSTLRRVISIEEKTRDKRAPFIVITDDDAAPLFKTDLKIVLPTVEETLSPLNLIVPLQVLAVKLAVKKGIIIK